MVEPKKSTPISLQDLIDQTVDVIQCIEETLAEYDEENYHFGLIKPPDEIPYDSCEFPEDIEDPLAIVRYIAGEEAAERIRYENDLKHILQVIEACQKVAQKRFNGQASR